MKAAFSRCGVAVALFLSAAVSFPTPAQDFCALNVSLEPRLVERADGSLGMRMTNPTLPGFHPLNLIYQVLRYPLGLADVSRYYRAFRADARSGADFFDRLVTSVGLDIDVNRTRLAALPRTGPVIVVVNHPIVGFDVVSVAREVARLRGADDVRMMLTDLFREIPEFEPHSLFVDVNATGNGANIRAAMPALRWLRAGHVIVMCPAGEVAFRNADGVTRDRPWAEGVAAMAQATGATVVPVFVHGELSYPFHRLRRWRYEAGALLMMREQSLLEGATIRLTVGRPLPPEELRTFERPQLAAYLRAYLYALAGNIGNTRRRGGAMPLRPPPEDILPEPEVTAGDSTSTFVPSVQGGTLWVSTGTRTVATAEVRFRPNGFSPGFDFRRLFTVVGQNLIEVRRTSGSAALLRFGIDELMAANPSFTGVVGSVVIPNRYQDTSRQLVVQYLTRHHQPESLRGVVVAARPPRFRTPLVESDAELLTARPDLGMFSRLIEAIEPAGLGLPPAIARLLEGDTAFLAFHEDSERNELSAFHLTRYRSLP